MARKGEYKNIVGNRYGRLTVIEYAGTRKECSLWLCRCDCGNTKIVPIRNLTGKVTRSCGCLQKEVQPIANKKTGLSQSRLYGTYQNIKDRCYNPKHISYKYYGGRGIKVCEEWLGEQGFEHFYEWSVAHGYMERENGLKRNALSIDRINVNGNYEPSNCRWVTLDVQANNKRNTRHIKINGVVDTVSNMSKRYGIYYGTLLGYANGVKPTKYADMDIEVVDETKLQKDFCN